MCACRFRRALEPRVMRDFGSGIIDNCGLVGTTLFQATGNLNTYIKDSVERDKAMPKQLLKASFHFFLAYWIVTFLGILLTVAFDVLYHPPSPEELGVPLTQAPAYLMTLPYHPLLNLMVWPVLAWFYLRVLPTGAQMKAEALRLGAFWAVVCIIIDLFGWVLIPHIWRMTFAEFYIDYQPWITLIYLIIFGSPPAVAYLLRRKEQRLLAAQGLGQ